ncbi:MAG: trehalase family glycosidase [Phycisphaerae bacterium]
MLRYVADLQRRCLHPPSPPFCRPWLEIGPGYCYGPACGHFDLVHEVLDLVAESPAIARDQMLNLLELQRADGLIPFVWMGENPARTWLPANLPMAERLAKALPYPPLWPVAVEACLAMRSDDELLAKAYAALCRQLAWFDTNRQLPDGGYYYADIFGDGRWESGMDQSCRFAEPLLQPSACVDATSHVFWCRRFAAAWARRLGHDAGPHEEALARLRTYIQQAFFCAETNWFHDRWTVNDPPQRHLFFEGIWPMVVGAASPAQADAALRVNLLNPDRFLTAHPIATVARSDPAFELRLWRGATWNSMTLWAVEGSLAYGNRSGARELLEKALDSTAVQFARTRTVWEFYHPLGGNPEDVVRKPGRAQIGPCRDYLGHNPLSAMARIWKGLA